MKIAIYHILQCQHGIYRLVRASLLARAAGGGTCRSPSSTGFVIFTYTKPLKAICKCRERWPSVSPFHSSMAAFKTVRQFHKPVHNNQGNKKGGQCDPNVLPVSAVRLNGDKHSITGCLHEDSNL